MPRQQLSQQTPTPPPANDPAAGRAQAVESYGKLPLSFEANQGQSDPQVKFTSRGNGYSLFLTDSAAILALSKTEKPDLSAGSRPGRLAPAGKEPISAKAVKTDVVRMELAGANRGLRVTGAEQLPGTANYFIGSDPAKWHSNVPTYSKVKYAGVYPGIDLVYYGNQRQLEYDFVVAPGADPKPVRLHFAGAEELRLDGNGDLQVIARNGQIAFHKPVVYQVKNGQKETVDGRFSLLANNNIGFELKTYDRSRELVIDPTLAYSTYLGGSVEDAANGIAVDVNGSAYVVGGTFSSDFPITAAAYQRTLHGSIAPNHSNAFVTKLNAAGTALIYSTYLGGTGRDYGNAIAVDAVGDAFVTGHTNSTGFPVTSGAYQTTLPAYSAAFVTKLNPSGSALIYSTYLGGLDGNANARAIAVDSTGDAYLTGNTNSIKFPVTSGAFQTRSRSGADFTAFVTRLNPEGSALVYSTYLGGTGGHSSSGSAEAGLGIALDIIGDAYVTGATSSTDFPVTSGALQGTNHAAANGSSNAFVAKVNPTGTALLYSTYLGGSGTADNENSDYGFGIAVDKSGSAFVAGTASSTDFPVTKGAFQTQSSNGGAFISKLNPSGSSLVYSTYLHGSGQDSANAIALDSSGDVYTAGSTSSTDFPVTSNAFQAGIAGAGNAFVIKLNPTGSELLYSSYLGGNQGDVAYGIAIDSGGNAYVDGQAGSTSFPVTSGAFQAVNKSSNGTAFVAKFALGATATTTAVISDGNPQKAGGKVIFTAHVAPKTGTGTPTGKMGFSVDGGAAVKVALDDTGHAAYPTSTLTAGTHKLTASYSGDANYSASSAGLAETIYGAAASIAAVSGTPQTAVYGAAFAKPLVVVVKDSVGDLVPGVTVTFSGPGLKFSSPTAITGANGQASVMATPAAAGSLTATAKVAGITTPVTFALNVTKALLTVTATNVSVPYNQAIPALKYGFTGFVNGDAATVVTGTAAETTTATKGSALGTYPITIAQGTLAAANYSFKFVNGTVTVTALGVTGTPSPTQTITIAEATAGATVYYTTDGTVPSATSSSSKKYGGTITVPAGATVKFIAVAPGYTPSAVRTVANTVQ